jgi:nucleoside-diphosphate-sugar epimerase
MNRIIAEDARTIATADLPWENLNGKTVLISGANGYVPAYFVYSFLARNDLFDSKIKVMALCRNEKKATEKFGDFLKRKDFKLLIQDVCEPIKINAPVHFFIAAASPANMNTRLNKPADTFLANVKGCYNMLELAKRNKNSKILFLSSVDAKDGKDTYSIAKRAAEELCKAYSSQHSVFTTIARPYQIIGAGISLRDGRLHADFMNQLKTSGKITLKTDGKAERTFLYISDAVLGMLFVLLKGKNGEIYDICHERGNATVLELAKLFAGKALVKVGKTATKSPPNVTGNSARLRKLGWKPRLSLSEGIKRMMCYYGVQNFNKGDSL